MTGSLDAVGSVDGGMARSATEVELSMCSVVGLTESALAVVSGSWRAVVVFCAHSSDGVSVPTGGMTGGIPDIVEDMMGVSGSGVGSRSDGEEDEDSSEGLLYVHRPLASDVMVLRKHWASLTRAFVAIDVNATSSTTTTATSSLRLVVEIPDILSLSSLFRNIISGCPVLLIIVLLCQ